MKLALSTFPTQYVFHPTVAFISNGSNVPPDSTPLRMTRLLPSPRLTPAQACCPTTKDSYTSTKLAVFLTFVPAAVVPVAPAVT